MRRRGGWGWNWNLGSRQVGNSVLPGGRGHRQITQNRPYKKIISGGKLVAVKVAVSSNKVLCYKFSKILKICDKMDKMKSRNTVVSGHPNR